MKKFRVSIIRDDQVIASKVLSIDTYSYFRRASVAIFLERWYDSLEITPRVGDDVKLEFVA